MSSPKQPNYGIDSPPIITIEMILSLVAFGVAAGPPHPLGLPARWIGLIVGLYFLLDAFAGIEGMHVARHAARRIPPRNRARIEESAINPRAAR